MRKRLIIGQWLALGPLVAACLAGIPGSGRAAPSAPAAEAAVEVLEVEGDVQFAPPDLPRHWHKCAAHEKLYPGYLFKTGPRSRATVRLADLTVVPLGPDTELEVFPPREERTLFSIFRGLVYFFRRGRPAEYQLQTPTASTVSRGTEFSVRVGEEGATEVMLFEGKLSVTNALGELFLSSGEGAQVAPGAGPVRTVFVDVPTILQWRLYYPAILDLEELSLPLEARSALKTSLAAYQQGDLQEALARYPAERVPQSPAERVYRAALLLVVGHVGGAATLLAPLRQPDQATRQTSARLAQALTKMVAVVQGARLENEPQPPGPASLATEWMAESYLRQAHGDLAAARRAALRATEEAPSFSFAWARLAELEFSYGVRERALVAVERSLALAPRNAQAVALKGFILAAQSSTDRAIEQFERAMALDGALANAWLGRGLCRIRQGQAEGGLLDLQTAAALEPQRSALRSYLGKAFNEVSDLAHAEVELNRARELDPSDPTPELYAALLDQQRNRLNEAVRELERSQVLNENRRLYRSKLLLDQDGAVRGANLAGVYRDAGLTEVSLREAVRAVNSDYANYSAHLFLANSYQPLRDPRQINLRYETAWFTEYLLANLLAPVGATTLSPLVSQEEYSRLFERDRLGVSSVTEYASRGDWFHSTAQFGTWRHSGYAAEATYRSENGDRPNEDLEQLTLNLLLQQELSPEDSVYLQAVYYDAESGDVTPYYDPTNAQRTLRVKENQEPLLLLGYHREWSPNSHTLLLAGRLQDTLQVDNEQAQFPALRQGVGGSLVGVTTGTNAPFDYESELEIYSIEAQQLWTGHDHTFVVGGRFQGGTFDTESVLGSGTAPFPGNAMAVPINFVTLPVAQEATVDFHRFGAYAYDHWQPLDPLVFTVGVAYDRVEYPENHRYAPLSTEETSRDQLSPKAGVTWTPRPGTTLRGAYTRSLGGVSLEQSLRLEPIQVAGFQQGFRSIIPEAVAGSLAAPTFETWGVAWDQKVGSSTYLGVQAEWLKSRAKQSIGAVEAVGFGQSIAQLQQEWVYDERTLWVSADQLIGQRWSVGVRYRLSQAELDRRIPEIPSSLGPAAGEEVEATLHQLWLQARFAHPRGWFGQAESVWSHQANHGYTPSLPGEDLWQFNLHGGYRFYRRRAEVRLSLLNLTDQDYHLNALNLTPYLPRNRTLAVSLRFAF